MKKAKRIVSMLLTAAVALAAPLSASANEAATDLVGDVMIDVQNRPAFYSVSGKITDMMDISNDDNEYYKKAGYTHFITIENEESGVSNIYVTETTYFASDAKTEALTEGASITVFYDANAPMLMIYPPQYTARVMTINLPDSPSVLVDRFDQDFLSYGGDLKLNLSDETPITYEDGTAFEDELTSLADKQLVVLYTITTRSIPPQTPPTKVVILNEKAVHPSYEVSEGELEWLDIMVITNEDLANHEYIIDHKKIEAPAAYVTDNGTIMLPVSLIARALGYETRWDGDTKTVYIGNGISLTIGVDQYIYMRTAPIELGTAPEIKDGTAYVPLSFFRTVMRLSNAYVFEGQVVINNDAPADEGAVITIE